MSGLALPRSDIAVGATGTVVWLHGEHDVATVDSLAETLAAAMALDDADLVVDLSDVRFMGSATVHVLDRVGALLRAQDRTLSLRNPSRSARRVFDALAAS